MAWWVKEILYKHIIIRTQCVREILQRNNTRGTKIFIEIGNIPWDYIMRQRMIYSIAKFHIYTFYGYHSLRVMNPIIFQIPWFKKYMGEYIGKYNKLWHHG